MGVVRISDGVDSRVVGSGAESVVSDSVMKELVDGTASVESGRISGKDTVGDSASTTLVPAGKSAGSAAEVRATGSVIKVLTLVTAPVASM